MTQCQFVYLRKGINGSIAGGQCDQPAHFVNQTLCRLHRNKGPALEANPARHGSDTPPTAPSELVHFPRIATDDEIRSWVTVARAMTNPATNRRRPCLFCGQAWNLQTEMAIATVDDVIRFKRIARMTTESHYSHVPSHHFTYGCGIRVLDGLPLCQSALLEGDDIIPYSDAIGWSCEKCLGTIRKDRLPPCALANGIWTGIGQVPELSGLTWIEEKLVARVHISIELFKCRLFHHWCADHFYPQPKICGHVLSYSVDPQTVLTDLPLSIDKINGLIKVIFISQKQIKFADVRDIRFFIVRRQRVYTALQWLIQYNPLYREIAINYENLGQLPTDGMIPEMFEQSMQTTNTAADDATHSRYDRPDPSEAGSNSDSDSEDDVVVENVVSGPSNPQTGNAISYR